MHAQKTSEILKNILESNPPGDTVTVGEFALALGDRAFSLVILVFALLTVFAGIVPGLSTITGVAMMLLALQMAAGREVIWLPASVSRKTIPQSALTLMVTKSVPHIIWLEKFLKPRWLWVSSRLGERMIALMIVAAAAVLSMPIPGGNFLPSISIAILALGLLERDGVFLLFAIAITIGSVVFMYQIIEAAVRELIDWVQGFF
jgi:hypothetical protein